jgi:hypothetical protein
MNIFQWGLFGFLIVFGGCVASLHMWPYLNMVAEAFIDLGLEPMQAILATVVIVTTLVMLPMPFIWRRA